MPWTADPHYDPQTEGSSSDGYAFERSEVVHLQSDGKFDARPKNYRPGQRAVSLSYTHNHSVTTETEALMQAVPGTEPATSAEELLERFESGKLDTMVQDCVDRLPERQREAFLLHRQGMSYVEIGSTLGIAKQNAHGLVQRARKTLQSEISVHPVYVERHLTSVGPNRNATRPADNDYVNDCRKIQKLLNLGTANARWRVARILSDLRDNGAPLDKVAQVTYLSEVTIHALADEFANG